MIRNGILLLGIALLSAQAQDLAGQLWAAAKKGDAAAVKALLGKGVDVNTRFRNETTALWWAAFGGHLDVAQALLDHGADLNAREASAGATPLMAAQYTGQAKIVGLLLAKGAQGAEETLRSAVNRGQPELVKAVLDNARLGPEALSTALGAAMRRGKPEVVELLSKAGAVAPATPAQEENPETLKRYTGQYRTRDGMEFSFTLKDGKLTGGNIFEDPWTMEPLGQDRFQPLSRYDWTVLTFHVKDGKVLGFAMKLFTDNLTFQKVDSP